MARIDPMATARASKVAIREGMVRRDAHWAPISTADMMLLPTWTPSGDGERRLVRV
jgi:hypothetical protein